MDKKVVLVTGGSKGIGAATVEVFAKHNYNIVLNYAHDEEVAKAVKDRIELTYSVSVLLAKADVSKKEDVQNMVEMAIQTFGHIDVLVNNAGIAIDQTFEDKTDFEFRKVLDVNLIGPFLMSKEVGKRMQEQGHGKIINVSSTNAIDTLYPESMDYDASKAGLISLTRNLATTFAPIIQVNAVAPGWVNTEMNKELDVEFVKEEEQKILLGRFADPSEIASVIYFLTTKEAGYINGTVIRIDGGWNA
ncbi:MAG: SDR family oxidoreductase [Bacilli bacterium]|jgi:3-oxoacyl-[acyl-carrier protein] reductase|nr:SDR family oxidoreductase [Bacilli bacterium]